MNLRVFVVFAFVLANPGVPSATPQQAAVAAHQLRSTHQSEIVQEFTRLLSIPNVATDHDNIQRNAELLKSMLEERGVDSRLLTVEGANPSTRTM